MTELRFDKALYRGEAVDEAAGTFARFARLEREEATEAWIVRVHGRTPDRERSVAGELANYALGATVKARASG